MSRNSDVSSTPQTGNNQAVASDPLAWIDEGMAELHEQGLYRLLHTHEGPQQVVLHLAGHELVNFGSNDYLGLADDPRLKAAIARSAARDGCGAGSSPLVTGHSTAHRQLESALAAFESAEAALVFSSGFAANVGTIASLVEREDAIFADEHNHASMIDGCRLSRARIHVYPHGDWQILESMLESSHARRRLIATESIFSMHGDRAPLVELTGLAQRHQCMLLVDEAHATGVLGAHGRGLCEELGVEQGVHVRIGTLSKALGGAGGFVVGSRQVVDWLLNRARTYIFSTGLPPALCAAGMAALHIVQTEPERRTRLLQSAESLRTRLRERGWSVGASSSQIVPLLIGDAHNALRLAQQLRREGVLVPAMRPPSVPGGNSLLRISLSTSHTPEMLARLVQALGDC
jgi:8-amino-7-oxononanoate synthase